MIDVLSPIKGLGEMAQSLVNARDTVVFQAKAIEFQKAILDAQKTALDAHEERATLIEEVSQLKQKVTQLEAWGEEKERYELKDIGTEVYAYVLKPGHGVPGDDHKLCERCYHHGEKAILHREVSMPGMVTSYVCHSCHADYLLYGQRQLGQPARRRR